MSLAGFLAYITGFVSIFTGADFTCFLETLASSGFAWL